MIPFDCATSSADRIKRQPSDRRARGRDGAYQIQWNRYRMSVVLAHSRLLALEATSATFYLLLRYYFTRPLAGETEDPSTAGYRG